MSVVHRKFGESRAGVFMGAGREERERSQRATRVLDALARFREADGGVAGGVDCLLAHARHADAEAERGRRREEMLARMRAEGFADDLAVELYDLALEEGVSPPFAFEVVRCGLAVRATADDPGVPAVESYPAEWLQERIDPADARRERLLRATFRRLRRLLEEHPTAEAALIAYAHEPDVAECEF